MKNKMKRMYILFYIAAALMYIASIGNFVKGETGMGAMFLCLGSSNLCNGSVWLSKYRQEDEG